MEELRTKFKHHICAANIGSSSHAIISNSNFDDGKFVKLVDAFFMKSNTKRDTKRYTQLKNDLFLLKKAGIIKGNPYFAIADILDRVEAKKASVLNAKETGTNMPYADLISEIRDEACSILVKLNGK